MDISDKDHLFCLLDVLGFSNLVTTVGLDSLYEKVPSALERRGLDLTKGPL